MKTFAQAACMLMLACAAGYGCDGLFCRPDNGEVTTYPCTGSGAAPAGLIGPDNLVYQGAFRLPQAGEAPSTFSWGGRAMTHYPPGDPAGTGTTPGSLFIAGNDSEDVYGRHRACYVAEVSIPQPVASKTLAELPVAELVQNFVDLRGDALYGPDIFFELPKQGLQYLAAGGGLAADTLYMNWGQHIENEYAPDACTGSGDPSCVAQLAARPLGAGGSLSGSASQGPWWIENATLYDSNDYLFEIPAAWADAHAGGRRLAAGRFRDGGQGGQGPVLFAVGPWLEGSPPAANARVSSVKLLRYGDFGTTDQLDGYEHADEWAGGAWLEAGGSSAVAFVGAKAIGQHCWYGWQRCPCDQMPCIEPEAVGGPGCYSRDAADCGLDSYYYCRCTPFNCDTRCVGLRGWWTERWETQIIFYDPADLEKVAAGTLNPWDPQPYACMSIDEHMFLNTPQGALDDMGTGWQRRYRLGAVAYDRTNNLLYVTELFADSDGGDQPVVHVWKVQ